MRPAGPPRAEGEALRSARPEVGRDALPRYALPSGALPSDALLGAVKRALLLGHDDSCSRSWLEQQLGGAVGGAQLSCALERLSEQNLIFVRGETIHII